MRSANTGGASWFDIRAVCSMAVRSCGVGGRHIGSSAGDHLNEVTAHQLDELIGLQRICRLRRRAEHSLQGFRHSRRRERWRPSVRFAKTLEDALQLHDGQCRRPPG